MYEQYDQKNEWVKDETLTWDNLADTKCPKCGTPLMERRGKFDYYICPCGFNIRLARFNQMIAEMQTRRLNTEHRKALLTGKKIKFVGTKVFKGERPKFNPINF